MKNQAFVFSIIAFTFLCGHARAGAKRGEAPNCLSNLEPVEKAACRPLETKSFYPAKVNQHKSSASYGSFNTEDVARVNPGSPIIFNRVSFATPNLTLQRGYIRLDEPGDYFVEFGVVAATEVLVAPRLVLLINNVRQPSTRLPLDPNVASGKMQSLATTIHVSKSPVAIQVINDGIEAFSTNPFTCGDISAFITIKKLQK